MAVSVTPGLRSVSHLYSFPADEAFFDSEQDPEKCCLLLEFILSCLYKIFLFDTQNFMSKERAEALMMPLVDQVTQSSLQSQRLPGSVFAFLCVLHSSLPDFFFFFKVIFFF